MVDCSGHVNLVEVVQEEFEHFLPIDLKVHVFDQVGQDQADYALIFLCDV